jgi:hypothetical protein
VPHLEITLDEQGADPRSDRVSYLLTIKNVSESKVSVQQLTPQVRASVRVDRAPDIEWDDTRSRVERLCCDLETLVRRRLVHFGTQELPGRVRRRLRLTRRVGVGDVPQDLSPVITGPDDAELARQAYFADPEDSSLSRVTFDLKAGQLQRVFDDWKKHEKVPEAAPLEPGATYARVYVMRFPRSPLDARKFSVGIDVRYRVTTADGSVTEPFVASGSRVQVISPRPWVLSVIATGASFLGVLLNTAGRFLRQDGAAPPPPFAWDDYRQAVTSAPDLVVAPVLALVFVNVFEHTSLGNRIRMALGWRSAMLVGVFCGLASPRVLATLRSALGA